MEKKSRVASELEWRASVILGQKSIYLRSKLIVEEYDSTKAPILRQNAPVVPIEPNP
jgi:hypothetical protein